MNNFRSIFLGFILVSLVLFLTPYISLLWIFPTILFSLRFILLALGITAYGLTSFKQDRSFISNLKSQIRKSSNLQSPIIQNRIFKRKIKNLKRILMILSVLFLLPYGIFVFYHEAIICSGVVFIEVSDFPVKIEYFSDGKEMVLDSRSNKETKTSLNKKSKIVISVKKETNRYYIFGKEEFISWKSDHWEVSLNQPLPDEGLLYRKEGPLRILNRTEIPLLSYYRTKSGEKFEIKGEFSKNNSMENELAFNPVANEKIKSIPIILTPGDIVFIKLSKLSLPLRGFVVGFDKAIQYIDSQWQLEITEAHLLEHKAPVYLGNYSGNDITAQILSYSGIPMYKSWTIPPSSIGNQDFITLIDEDSKEISVLEGYKLHIHQAESIIYNGTIEICPFMSYQAYDQKWKLKLNE